MDCKISERYLEVYLAGDLTPAERMEIREHQVACPRCQETAERATRLNGLLRDGLAAAAAMTSQEQVTLCESVLRQVQKSRPSLPRVWVPRLVTITAALAVTIVIGLAL